MNENAGYRLRRVAVALTGRDLPDALIALCQRHARGDGMPEFRAVFIEDNELIKAAGLPFTVEFCALTMRPRPLAASDIEAHFAREARAAARGFAELGRRTGFHGHFEVVRGRKFAAVLAALADADAMLVPMGPTRLARGPLPPRRFRAIIDSSAGSVHVRGIAEQLAASEGVALECVTMAEAGANADDNAGSSPAQERARSALESLLARSDVELTVLAGSLLQELTSARRDPHTALGAPLLVVA